MEIVYCGTLIDCALFRESLEIIFRKRIQSKNNFWLTFSCEYFKYHVCVAVGQYATHVQLNAAYTVKVLTSLKTINILKKL